MRLLLLGKAGQLGWELQRALAPLGELIATDRAAADLGRPESLPTLLRATHPDVIVNAAAYTAVDKAETDVDQARVVNTESPALLASVAAELGAWLVHYSTDYVFDGSGHHPRDETSPVGPLNVYGRTKFDGEERIRASGCRHLILRTSWLYAARGDNFAKKMLRLAIEQERLTVIDDQVGAPTGADLLADVSAHVIRASLAAPETGGTYHVAATGQTSWYGYARFVLQLAQQAGVTLKAGPDSVQPIPTSAHLTPAQRPLNSRLETAKLRNAFGLHLPHWQVGVERMLTEVLTR